MSYDPNTGAPQRPRSTPIPDPDRPGQGFAPPTPAQFLGEQSLPWTPQSGPNVNAPFSVGADTSGLSFGGPVISGGGGGGRRLIVIMALISAVVVGSIAAVVVVTHKAAETVQREIARIPDVQPPITEFSPVTPTTAPVAPATAVTIGPAQTTPATVLVTTPATVAPTVAPVATEPPPPVTAFPGGGASVYDALSTRAIADQLELAMAGEPTQFTQIILLADQAIASAQDPAQPGQQVGAYWQDGSIGGATITSSGGGDITPLLFTEGEVNWEAVAGLVAAAPGQVNMPDGQVSSVVVQRVGRGNPIPIVIDVYVDGSAGQRFLEASADGTVIGVH